MGLISQLGASFLLLCLVFHTCLHQEVAGDDDHDHLVAETRREGIEIIIGGGGPAPAPEYEGCPPPPPEECPPPPPPPSPPPPPPPSPPPPPPPKPNDRIELARRVIQRFAPRIEYDPQNVKKTWTGPDVCKYKGFTCAQRPDIGKKAVAAVEFNEFNFYGSKLILSDFLEQLEDLSIFHVNSNNFTLSIPQMTSKIKYLFELDVSNNKLSGEFPREAFYCKNLTFLDLRFNNFYGAVPPEVFKLELDVLFINNNNFWGNLPENLGDTPALYLTFANNKFTGPIPKSIGQAKNLLEVLFLNNKFSGCLPYEIGNLRNTKIFDAGSNLLTGPIPHSFGCLASIDSLNLADNQLYGPVPEIVCKLPKLRNLSLSHNYFTQVGPECRKLIDKKYLDVRMNCILDLPSQRSPEKCRIFFSTKRTCSDEKKLTLIPCMKNGYPNVAETGLSDQKSTYAAAPAPPFRTYEALKPHRL